jgi:hypothetical protein
MSAASDVFMKQLRGAYASVDITVSTFTGKEIYLDIAVPLNR